MTSGIFTTGTLKVSVKKELLATKLQLLAYWRPETQFGGHSSKWRTFEVTKMTSGIFSNGTLEVSVKKELSATKLQPPAYWRPEAQFRGHNSTFEAGNSHFHVSTSIPNHIEAIH